MSDDRRNPYQPAREPLIDRQLREAMAGEGWDELPYRGERIPLEDDSAAGDWALAHRMLRNAGVAPPWIEADKAARRLLDERNALLARARGAGPLGAARRRAELVRIVEAANREIAAVNAGAPSDRQHRRLLDPAAELVALDAAEAEGDAADRRR